MLSWVDQFWQHWVGLAAAPWGQGGKGEVEKGESQEVEGRGGGGRNPKKAKRKWLLHILVHDVKNKQHFVTIVTVTIYLTQVYIHFYLCNLCPSPTIHNCCAQRISREIRTNARWSSFDRAHATQFILSQNSPDCRSDQGPQYVWPPGSPGRRGNITSFSFYFCPQMFLQMRRGCEHDRRRFNKGA